MKILIVGSRYPWPARRGDQLRAAQMARLLASEHQVTLLVPAPASGQGPPPPLQAAPPPLQEPPLAAPPPGVRVETYQVRRGVAAAAGLARAAARGLALQSGLFYQPDLARRLRRLAPAADLVVMQLVRLVLHLDDCAGVPLVADLIDSLSLNLARRAALDRLVLRPALLVEARLVARAERLLAGRARRSLVVCERDRRHLAAALPEALAERLVVVPPAVAPAAEGAAAAPAAPPGASGPCSNPLPLLAITGNLGYFVNADAVRWFLREVWSELRARRPGLRLLVAGERPSTALRRALGAAAGAELAEKVPDLRPLLAAATVALAPLRCGSGVPIKILEAWAAGVPVVASPWAAAGTTARPGDDLRIAEEPREWLDTLGELLDSPEERRRLAANGRRRLAADYSPDLVRARLLAAVSAASAAGADRARPDRASKG